MGTTTQAAPASILFVVVYIELAMVSIPRCILWSVCGSSGISWLSLLARLLIATVLWIACVSSIGTQGFAIYSRQCTRLAVQLTMGHIEVNLLSKHPLPQEVTGFVAPRHRNALQDTNPSPPELK